MEQIPFIQKLLFKYKNEKKSNWLFIIGIAGILLIFASGLFPARDKVVKQSISLAQQNDAEYIDNLEKRLSSILEKTQGVGKVEVMLTLEGSVSTIYAQNEQSDTQTQTETPSKQELSQKNAYKLEHVLIESSGEKKPLVESSLAPEIKGVAIVCTGGGDISVIKNVTDLVSALLALPTNRIWVTKMI